MHFLSRLLPGKRVFFIYTHKNGKDRFRSGLKANTEISYFGYSALAERFPKVTFLRCQGEPEKKIAQIRSQDVVIGHVGETFLRAKQRTNRLIAFYPWAGHEDRSTSPLFNCLPFEEEKRYWEAASSLILLTSEYNVAQFLEKPTNFWYPFVKETEKSKRVRIVHQPLDLALFPRIKFDYLTNDFLYIGNDAHMKCLPDSRALVSALGRTLHEYGVARKLDNLDPQATAHLASEADFFIQPGLWEGQCVSILEAAARGFIPVVSPETGYPYHHPFLLKTGDFAYNLKVLKELLLTSPEEKKLLGDQLHQALISDTQHNEWKKLTDVLVEEVQKLLV